VGVVEIFWNSSAPVRRRSQPLSGKRSRITSLIYLSSNETGAIRDLGCGHGFMSFMPLMVVHILNDADTRTERTALCP
jgi:hypothetical protein